jgi:hypothetical protein
MTISATSAASITIHSAVICALPPFEFGATGKPAVAGFVYKLE